MAQSEGSIAHPFREVIFGDKIVSVHWGGGVGIVEITYGNQYNVISVDPADEFAALTEDFSGAEITRESYRDKYILKMTTAPIVDQAILEDELTGVWVIDGYVIGAMTDDLSADVSNGTIAFGYPPNVHTTNGQVWLTRTTHTHPDGTSVTYISGFQLGATIQQGVPNEQPPAGAPNVSDCTDTQEYLWYRDTTIDAQTADIIRRSWLVNFGSGKVKAAKILSQTQLSVPYPVAYSYKVYADGAFTVGSDGRLTPSPSRPTLFSGSGSTDSTVTGIIQQINRNGFV